MGSLQRCCGRRAQAGTTRRLPGALLTRRTRSGSGRVGRRLWLRCKRWGGRPCPARPPPFPAAPALRVPASPPRSGPRSTPKQRCHGGACPAPAGRAGVLAPRPGSRVALLECAAAVPERGDLAQAGGVRAHGARPMFWDVSGLPEEGFPRKAEAPGLGPCPLPATVAILALLPFNYRPRQAWPRVPLHYAIAIGAAPPSRPTPVDN